MALDFKGSQKIRTQQEYIQDNDHQHIDPFYNFSHLITDMQSVLPSFKTGYAALDTYWSIPNEALTIVAGRPSHGKTSFLLNLFLNTIYLYPEHSFFFFSYEVAKKQLLLNVLNIMANVELDTYFNSQLIEQYLVYNIKAPNVPSGAYKQLAKSKSKLEESIRSGRLGIIDEHFYVDELVAYFKYLKDTYNIGIIFIDYIQKIKIKGQFASRQLEIQKISEFLLEAALKLSLPIVLGAQFNREVTSKSLMDESRLREAGDIEQDANTVIGIWNGYKQRQLSHEHANSMQKSSVPLDIVLLKNRSGKNGNEIQLNFNGPTLAITEFVSRTWD